MRLDKDSGDRALNAVGVALLIAIFGYVFYLAFGLDRSLKWTVTWEVWEVASAVGTVAATGVALWLAYRGIRRERNQVSRVVSAWVTDEYLPSPDVPAYRRRVIVHVANESDEPVFDVQVRVIVGEPPIRLGPLSAPTQISVLPQRRELTFDISTALRAHRNTWAPRAEISFIDPHGHRWFRDTTGTLREERGTVSGWLTAAHPDERQLGDQETPENPMMVALAFLAVLQDPNLTEADLVVTLAPEADGWALVDWPSLRREYRDFAPTSMVDYPAENIARVKLVGDKHLRGSVVVGGGFAVPGVKFLTLTRSSSIGWRVYGIGSTTRPDDIKLPADAFDISRATSPRLDRPRPAAFRRPRVARRRRHR